MPKSSNEDFLCIKNVPYAWNPDHEPNAWHQAKCFAVSPHLKPVRPAHLCYIAEEVQVQEKSV